MRGDMIDSNRVHEMCDELDISAGIGPTAG